MMLLIEESRNLVAVDALSDMHKTAILHSAKQMNRDTHHFLHFEGII
jgi:hypothetical protein